MSKFTFEVDQQGNQNKCIGLTPIEQMRWQAALACMERGFMNIDPMLSCEEKIKYQVDYCFKFADAMLKEGGYDRT